MSSTTMFMSTEFIAAIGKEAMSEFLWLVILGGFVCFIMAWGIGANDVANAFGTSVGAKALTLKQATVLAGIFEFVGAIGLGAAVTKTVRKGITDYAMFEGEEDLLMLGMFCALCSAALWLYIATKHSLPVSTTQSIVGAIAGFTITAKGIDAVFWEKIIEIVIFWVATPVFAAIGCILFFWPIRKFLLRRSDSYEMTLRWWPSFVFIVAFIMTLFLIIKGLKRLQFDYEQQLGLSFMITGAVSVGCAIIAYFVFIFSGLVDRRVTKIVTEIEQQEKQIKAKKIDHQVIELEDIDGDESENDQATDTANSVTSSVENENKSKSRVQIMSGSMSALSKGLNVDIHDDLEQREIDIQNNSEKFGLKTEKAFAWLQVCSASLGAFAHGSNDVANAVAPFAAMIGLYESGESLKEVKVPEYVLVIGAVGIVIGLSTYGYKIIKCLGVRMAAMSSTRGYCIELSSALTVILASVYGMPASTTHAQVGATVGIGMLEITRNDTKMTWKQVINWKLLIQVFLGWIATLFVSGLTSSILYSILAYSPYAGNVVHYYNNDYF